MRQSSSYGTYSSGSDTTLSFKQTCTSSGSTMYSYAYTDGTCSSSRSAYVSPSTFQCRQYYDTDDSSSLESYWLRQSLVPQRRLHSLNISPLFKNNQQQEQKFNKMKLFDYELITNVIIPLQSTTTMMITSSISNDWIYSFSFMDRFDCQNMIETLSTLSIQQSLPWNDKITMIEVFQTNQCFQYQNNSLLFQFNENGKFDFSN